MVYSNLMIFSSHSRRPLLVKLILLFVLGSFMGIAEEEEPRDKPLFPRADSVAFFKQHANTNLFFIYNTSAGKQLKERLDDIKALEFGLGLVPMHVCEMSAGATNKPFTVVFEASVPWRSARERDRWEFVAFGNDGTLEDFSNFSFRFRGDSPIVLDCYTTNVFQKITPDVLCIEFIDDDMKSVDRDTALTFRKLFGKYCCPKVYFAISPERGMLIIRIEDENKRVYFPNLSHPYTDEMMLRSVLRVFLNKYECREEALQKLTVPEILNLFFYWNSKEFKGELGEDLQEVHESRRIQQMVGKWLKHEHPWVRQAANYYLITYGDFGSTNVNNEALSDAPARSGK